jgi:sugar phosphate isomerase/epimerase
MELETADIFPPILTGLFRSDTLGAMVYFAGGRSHMKLGISSYSLDLDMKRGAMSLFEVIEWAARQGAECFELVPFSFKFQDEAGKLDSEFIKRVRKQAADAGLELINYSVLADLCKTGEALEAEIKRLEHEVDIVAELGIPQMRHDVCAFRRPLDQNGLAAFDAQLPFMVEGARRVTEYAKAHGVRTMVENHGFFANGCDRVERILYGVDHDNYGLLYDTGNITCMDEDASVAALRLAKTAKMIHLKDFYIRMRDPGDATQFDCKGHWFKTMAGRYLRGAILAQGDLDIWEILKAIKAAEYDGGIVIEFEGLEDARYATAVSLANARRIWGEV